MSIAPTYPYYLANEPIAASNKPLDVTNKYTGEIATSVAQADASAVEIAIQRASDAARPMRLLKAYQRAGILRHCARRIAEQHADFAQLICVEAGKPITNARIEVDRAIDIFENAAEEATRIYGEVIPLDTSSRSAHYTGMWKRVPVGPCAFITPFNFPLHLVAHKVAPAIAAGCPFILKPAPLTPISAIMVGKILNECELLPQGAFSIFPCSNDDAKPLVSDERIKLLSFTGSCKVGWMLKSAAGKKKVILELGGNAACIVDEDWDVDDAVTKIVAGGFSQSGQTCISVQRVLVHASRYDEFKSRLVQRATELQVGDPSDEGTTIGPMISTVEADRLESWVESARNAGTTIVCGGNKNGLMFEATVMEHVPKNESIWCNEAFGPVVVLEPFDNFDSALQMINDSRFGLHAGIFTRDIYKAHQAWDELEVGGVIIGDVPSWRADHMPYGGVKDSGIGREGPRYAIEDMTELRMMVVRSD